MGAPEGSTVSPMRKEQRYELEQAWCPFGATLGCVGGLIVQEEEEVWGLQRGLSDGM